MLSRVKFVVPVATILATAITLTAGAAPKSLKSLPLPVAPRPTAARPPGTTSLDPVITPLPAPIIGVLLAPAPVPPAPSPFVTRSGSSLSLNGHSYRYTGTNAYELATYWPVNMGCGGQVDDLDGFFASLPPESMVNFTAPQAMAFNNKTTNTIDFTGIDRVIKAAERHGQKLEISLSGQPGVCDDGHWHDQAWYDSGYRQAFNDDGRNLARLSYWDYIHLIVPRYKNSPAVAIWEPVGEPEGSICPPGFLGDKCYGVHRACLTSATASLRNFFDTVGAEIKRLDHNHLISTGTLSRDICGLAAGGYQRVLESPSVDIASYHDYGHADQPLPPDLATAIKEAHASNKVFVMDEAGINAGSGCGSTALQLNQFKAKMDAQFAAGSSGFQTWNWVPTVTGACSYDFAPGSPLVNLLVTYRVPA
jgi:mannan endo-1,4-beta-mannosidase